MHSSLVRVIVPTVIGVLIGAGGVAYLHRNDVTAAAGSQVAVAGGGDEAADGLTSLRSDVARMKVNQPSQSHTMADVGYHWTNLWFAGEKKNWPLAMFYFQEAREHILWTVRLRPVRKADDGSDVNLMPIFEGIDTSAFKAVAEAIQSQNSTAFAAAYRETLQACYGCHKASGLVFLRPEVPTEPSQRIINFDSTATWPQ